MKVFLLHCEISPYRLPLFESLSNLVDLHVYYCRTKATYRKWDIQLDKYSFKRKVHKGINLGPFVINPTILFNVLFGNYDVYILGEDPRIFFSKCIVVFIAKLLRKTVILWSGMVENNYYKGYKRIFDPYILDLTAKIYFRYADAFIAYSERTKAYLLRRGVPSERMYQGTQVISKEQLMSDGLSKKNRKQYLHFDDNKKIILCVSNLTKQKGLNYLIEAFKQLNRKDTVLIFAGTGDEEENFRTLASDCSHIFFPGFVKGDEKVHYYSIADIFILPTLHDSWGLVINEAMMFGLPVITTNKAGCSQELIKGNGIIIKAGCSKAIEDALLKLLDDVNLRAKMGKKSLEIIKEYTIENVTNTFFKAISNASNLKF